MSDLIKEVLMGKLFGSGGGSGGSAGVSPKEVNFYDYDGTCVHAYTVAEAQALSELPAGPEHPGLVFQGWNWSLEGVKGLTRAMNIGAMYTTDDGTTRLYITLQEGRTSPMLGVGVNGTVTVDWGDGTEPDVLTGTSTSTTVWTENHAYAAPGDYVIQLTVDGEMAFNGTGSSNTYAYVLRYTNSADNRNTVYQNAIKKVEIGSGVTAFSSYAFAECHSIKTMSIPASVLQIGEYAFQKCYALKAVTLPAGFEGTGAYAFYDCNSLNTVAFCENMKRIGNYTFRDCRNLTKAPIPESVERLGSYAFYNCYALSYATIPKSMNYYPGYAFYFCRSLAAMIIPENMTNVPDSMFRDCTGMSFYDFTAHTAIPTLANTSAFSNIPADCIFLIPSALYDEWIAATNWTTFADRCVAK